MEPNDFYFEILEAKFRSDLYSLQDRCAAGRYETAPWGYVPRIESISVGEHLHKLYGDGTHEFHLSNPYYNDHTVTSVFALHYDPELGPAEYRPNLVFEITGKAVINLQESLLSEYKPKAFPWDVSDDVDEAEDPDDGLGIFV